MSVYLFYLCLYACYFCFCLVGGWLVCACVHPYICMFRNAPWKQREIEMRGRCKTIIFMMPMIMIKAWSIVYRDWLRTWGVTWRFNSSNWNNFVSSMIKLILPEFTFSFYTRMRMALKTVFTLNKYLMFILTTSTAADELRRVSSVSLSAVGDCLPVVVLSFTFNRIRREWIPFHVWSPNLTQ